MEENKIKEIFTIIEMFETTLCALKWHRHNSSAFLEIDSIITVYDFILNKLKVFAVITLDFQRTDNFSFQSIRLSFSYNYL